MTDIAAIIRRLQDALNGGDPVAALSATAEDFARAEGPTAEAWFLRGQVAERAGDYPAACEALARAADGDAAAPAHRFYHACFLLNTGRPWAAGEIFEDLSRGLPGNADLMAGQARAHLETGRYIESARIYETLLPDAGAPDIRCQAALARAMAGDMDAARRLLDGHENLYPDLIQELHGRDALSAALHFAAAATEMFPRQPLAWNFLGIVHAALDNADAAAAAYRKGLSLAHDEPNLLFNMGSLQASVGDTAGAVETFRNALASHPDDIRVLRYIADITRLQPDDPALTSLEALSADAALSDYDRAQVSYALGKAYDDQGRYQDAVNMYLEGGLARRRNRGYGAEDEIALLDRISAMFAGADLSGPAGGGAASAKPVFIVGLPRSGTTLLEQILAGHDDVRDGGELPHLRDAVLEHADRRRGSRTLPSWEFLEGGTLPDAGAVSAIAGSYLAAIDALAPDSARVIDKQPLNDRYLGFAALAFPNATLIHCVRDLRDTSVSCLSKNFEAEFAFTDTLEGMAAYARAQRNLMRFWERTFPGRIVTVSYETLVAEPEAEARKIVAALGLDWSDKCLDLASSGRIVRTASAQQVRGDVYRTSVNRWEKYMPAIEPLIRGLGDEP